MTYPSSTHSNDWRVLILTSLACDSEVLSNAINEAVDTAAPCDDMADLCRRMKEGAAATVLCEEALTDDAQDCLVEVVSSQPDWSDPPLIVLATRGARRGRGWRLLQGSKGSSHTLLLNRPVSLAMLHTAVRAAVACRARQYQVRDELQRRQKAEEHLQLVTAELDHRVRNTLAIVDSLARQSARHATGVGEFCDVFTERLRSFANAHSLLTRTEWQGMTIEDIIASELGPRLEAPERVTFGGPKTMLPPRAALGLHMAVHELATNAAKYGAASTAEGRIEVTWALAGKPEPSEVEVRWTETGGPPVSEPTRTGFGTSLVQRLIEHELGGEVHTEFRPEGVRCEIRFPLAPAYGPGAPLSPEAALL